MYARSPLTGDGLMLQTPRWAFAAVVVLALSVPRAAFAAKTYQVTGPVLEVTDKMIVVEKNKERWEIERNADTKVEGELKVGEKVTIYYHMTADKVETKGAK